MWLGISREGERCPHADFAIGHSLKFAATTNRKLLGLKVTFVSINFFALQNFANVRTLKGMITKDTVLS